MSHVTRTNVSTSSTAFEKAALAAANRAAAATE